MADKKHLVYSKDGDGYANNQLACSQYARDMGLKSGQWEVRQLEATNECQTAGLYVTDAAKSKIEAKRRRAQDEEYI